MYARAGTQLSILLIVLLQLCNGINHVQSKLCSRTEWGMKNVYETYWHTYSVMKNADPNCTMECTKIESVEKTQLGRYVLKNTTSLKFDCCTGYERDKNNSKVCNPKCSKNCTNGICQNPDACRCNTGYILDLKNKYNCLPNCSKPCGNGTCVSPETCDCTKGYTFANGTCQPDCSEPCTNGTCISPDICQCLPGYRKSKNSTCGPYCPSGCPNGTCVGPETCGCHSGYIETEKNVCQPHCSNGCLHGVCVSPELCLCDSGWMIPLLLGPSEGICQPICTKHCVNGMCVAPETCACFAGYILEENICKPNCSGGCSHGLCVSSGTCICNPGWYRSNVNGTCVTDTFELDHTGENNWLQSIWMYILAVGILMVLLILLTIFFCIKRTKRNKSRENDGAMGIPAQEIAPKIFNKPKCEYDVLNKQSQL